MRIGDWSLTSVRSAASSARSTLTSYSPQTPATARIREPFRPSTTASTGPSHRSGPPLRRRPDGAVLACDHSRLGLPVRGQRRFADHFALRGRSGRDADGARHDPGQRRRPRTAGHEGQPRRTDAVRQRECCPRGRSVRGAGRRPDRATKLAGRPARRRHSSRSFRQLDDGGRLVISPCVSSPLLRTTRALQGGPFATEPSNW
jgi:hypothetical protein